MDTPFSGSTTSHMRGDTDLVQHMTRGGLLHGKSWEAVRSHHTN